MAAVFIRKMIGNNHCVYLYSNSERISHEHQLLFYKVIVQQELATVSLLLVYNVGQVCKLRLLMVSMVCSICVLVIFTQWTRT